MGQGGALPRPALQQTDVVYEGVRGAYHAEQAFKTGIGIYGGRER